MKVFKQIVIASCCAAALACAGSASAALGSAESGLEATGSVDLDGFGGAPGSFDIETEIDLPFDRSIVTVSDALPGTYEYFSSADVGNLALKVKGSLTNSSESNLSDPELGLLRASAEVRDIITLTTARTDSYDVTMELIVTGSIAAGEGSDGSANAFLDFGLATGSNGNDSGFYGTGLIADTLSVTRTVSGPEVDLDFTAFLSFRVLSVAAGDTVVGQLNNTAFIRLILPQDVIVASSQSGTFGVVIPTPVPEPETYAVMAVGLALVSVGFRRRMRR